MRVKQYTRPVAEELKVELLAMISQQSDLRHLFSPAKPLSLL